MSADRNDRFFSSINPRGSSLSNFFLAQMMGEHTLRTSIQEACEKNGIVGVGDKHGIVTHSLRGTVATLLLEAGRTDTATALRTGHLQNDSLKSYKNLAGSEGKIQQRAIFSGKLDNLSALCPNKSEDVKSKNIGTNVASLIKFVHLNLRFLVFLIVVIRLVIPSLWM